MYIVSVNWKLAENATMNLFSLLQPKIHHLYSYDRSRILKQAGNAEASTAI